MASKACLSFFSACFFLKIHLSAFISGVCSLAPSAKCLFAGGDSFPGPGANWCHDKLYLGYLLVRIVCPVTPADLFCFFHPFVPVSAVIMANFAAL